jgi:hypothetical protein
MRASLVQWVYSRHLISDSMTSCLSNTQHDVSVELTIPPSNEDRHPCSEQKIAQFRTHYLTKEIAYVSTQSGYFPIDTEMI